MPASLPKAAPAYECPRVPDRMANPRIQATSCLLTRATGWRECERASMKRLRQYLLAGALAG